MAKVYLKYFEIFINSQKTFSNLDFTLTVLHLEIYFCYMLQVAWIVTKVGSVEVCMIKVITTSWLNLVLLLRLLPRIKVVMGTRQHLKSPSLSRHPPSF